MTDRTLEWDFLNRLKKQDLNGIVSRYFTKMTTVSITRVSCQKKYSNVKTFHKFLEQVEVLQYHIKGFEILDGMSTFIILLITKNHLNQIDLTQHNITHRWNGNKIVEHHHTIITH